MERLEAEQPLVYQAIKNMVDRGQVPHALIFHGDKSTSKYEMAKFFVKYLYANFYETSIEESPVTRRIDDESFTNVKVIEPSKSIIKKDQIASVLEDASKSSLEDGPKVFIFKNSDGLNAQSGNSLLKFIEEPEEGIYIIFLIDNINNILPTIKSRCVLMSFKPLNKRFIKERLDESGLDPNISSVFLEYTQNEDEVKSLIDDEQFFRIYSMVSELFNEPFEKKGSMILYLLENYNYLQYELNEFDKKAKNTDKQKKMSAELADMFLSFIIFYLNDILRYLEFSKEDFVWTSEKDRIKELSNYFSKDSLTEVIKEALEIKGRIKLYINLHLNLDILLMDIERAAGRSI